MNIEFDDLYQFYQFLITVTLLHLVRSLHPPPPKLAFIALGVKFTDVLKCMKFRINILV